MVTLAELEAVITDLESLSRTLPSAAQQPQTPFSAVVAFVTQPHVCNETLLGQLTTAPFDARDAVSTTYNSIIQAVKRVAISKAPGDDYMVLHALVTKLLEYGRDLQQQVERTESCEAHQSQTSSGLAPNPVPLDHRTWSGSSTGPHTRSSPSTSIKPASRSTTSHKSVGSPEPLGSDLDQHAGGGGGRGAVAGQSESRPDVKDRVDSRTSERGQTDDDDDDDEGLLADRLDERASEDEEGDEDMRDGDESDALPPTNQLRAGPDGQETKTLSQLEEAHEQNTGDEEDQLEEDEGEEEAEQSWRKTFKAAVKADDKGKVKVASAAIDGEKKKVEMRRVDKMDVDKNEEDEDEEPTVIKKPTRSTDRPTVQQKVPKRTGDKVSETKGGRKPGSSAASTSKQPELSPEEFDSSDEFISKRSRARKAPIDSDEEEMRARRAKQKAKKSAKKEKDGKKRVKRAYTTEEENDDDEEEEDGEDKQIKTKSRRKGKGVIKKRSRKKSGDSEHEMENSADDGDGKKSKGPSSRHSSRSSVKVVVEKKQKKRPSNASTNSTKSAQSTNSRSTRASTSTYECPVDPNGTRHSGRLHRGTEEASDSEEDVRGEYKKGDIVYLKRKPSVVIRSTPRHVFFWHAELPSCGENDDLAEHECLIHQDLKSASTVSRTPPLPSLANSKAEQRKLDLALEFADSESRVREWYDLAKTSLPSLASDDECAKGGFKGRRTKQAQKVVVQESSSEDEDEEQENDKVGARGIPGRRGGVETEEDEEDEEEDSD